MLVDYSAINRWYEESFEEGWMDSSGDGALRWAMSSSNPGRGALIIVPGRTESIEKYHEVCWDLRDQGFTICVYDHLGQGKSHRLLDDREKGHIDTFSTYVLDLKRLIKTIVKPIQNGPVILLAHSMGGTIGALARQNSNSLIDGLIMVSPMLQIHTGRALRPAITEMICRMVSVLGGKERYIWGGGPFKASVHFDGNVLTTDSNRFFHNHETILTNRELALGSPTFGWLLEAFRAMREAGKQARSISCPTIIFRSLNERVVRLAEMDRFCNKVKHCQMVSYDECHHELLMERDAIRNDLLVRIKKFLGSFQ